MLALYHCDMLIYSKITVTEHGTASAGEWVGWGGVGVILMMTAAEYTFRCPLRVAGSPYVARRSSNGVPSSRAVHAGRQSLRRARIVLACLQHNQQREPISTPLNVRTLPNPTHELTSPPRGGRPLCELERYGASPLSLREGLA